MSLSSHEATPAPEEDERPCEHIDLPGTLTEASRRVLAEMERHKIKQALKEDGGNRWGAADILQISDKTLMARLKEYGLE